MRKLNKTLHFCAVNVRVWLGGIMVYWELATSTHIFPYSVLFLHEAA